MRVSKALHRAAHKSLDGHIRFVVCRGHQAYVLALRDFASGVQGMQIEVAFSCGRRVTRCKAC